MEVQVDNESYYNEITYNDKGRFNSFWHQVDSILALNPEKILEVGTGNGFVRFVLQKSNILVTTVDIDKNLKPDILASVLSIPVKDKCFDVALCCQVLEHLPYENFILALKELHRVVKHGVVLSLPDLNRIYRVNLQLPLLGEVKFLYRIPRLRPLPWTFDGEHYWNISCKGYPLSRIINDINMAGFIIDRTFCVFEISWHRFFILRKH